MLAEIHVESLYKTTRHLSENFLKISTREYRKINIVVWRNDMYSVFLFFLLKQNLRLDNIRFVCFDQFWANVRIRENDFIIFSLEPKMQRYEVNINESLIDTDISALERQKNKNFKDYHLSSFEASTSERQLYLCLDTSMHLENSFELCYVVWVNDFVTDIVSITDVFFLLVVSNVEPKLCSSHNVDSSFINIKTSTWVQNYWDKSQSKQHSILVFARDDTDWAIFVADQITLKDDRIVFRCSTCVFQNYNRARALEYDNDDSHAQRCFVALMSFNFFPHAGLIDSFFNSLSE